MIEEINNYLNGYKKNDAILKKYKKGEHAVFTADLLDLISADLINDELAVYKIKPLII